MNQFSSNEFGSDIQTNINTTAEAETTTDQLGIKSDYEHGQPRNVKTSQDVQENRNRFSGAVSHQMSRVKRRSNNPKHSSNSPHKDEMAWKRGATQSAGNMHGSNFVQQKRQLNSRSTVGGAPKIAHYRARV